MEPQISQSAQIKAGAGTGDNIASLCIFASSAVRDTLESLAFMNGTREGGFGREMPRSLRDHRELRFRVRSNGAEIGPQISQRAQMRAGEEGMRRWLV